MVRSAPRGKPMSKSLSSRLGGGLKKGGTGGGAGGGAGGGVKKIQGDARLKIIQASRSKTVDARDKLGQLAKATDARQKLEKLRNLKEGKLEVKNLGGITLTKKIDGKILLTTNKNKTTKAAETPKEVHRVGNFTKTVLGSGKVSLTTGKQRTATGMRSKSDTRMNRNPQSGRPERGRVSDSERLDAELMMAAVNKEEYQRIRDYRSTQSSDRSGGVVRSRTSPHRSRSPLRSRSPMRARSPQRSRSPRRSRSPIRPSNGREEWRRREASPPRRGGRFDYDEPRMSREEEELRRRGKAGDFEEGFTMGGRLEQVSKVSPLQGTKIVITNLQTSVTQDDIIELFGDVGALRRAKLLSPGHAEVTFVNHSHAVKAVEIYHNRQLDGKPMKCQLLGSSSAPAVTGSSVKLPTSLPRSKSGDSAPVPDVESIHRALFFNKKTSGKKPLFTITMPKKGKEEPHYYD